MSIEDQTAMERELNLPTETELAARHAEREHLNTRVRQLNEEVLDANQQRNLALARVNELARELVDTRTELEGRITTLTHDQDARTELEDRITTLTDNQDTLHERIRTLGNERDALRTRVSVLTNGHNDELEQFKQQVAEVATRYARIHEMCSVVDQALRELGLSRLPSGYSATLEITVEFTADMRERNEEPERSWVRDSIQTTQLRRAIMDSFGMDSDHTGSDISDISFDIVALDMNDD